MPELPEVQTLVSQINNEFSGKQVSSTQVFHNKTLKPQEAKLMENKVLKAVDRYGKYMVFRFSGDLQFIVHLKMTGRFFIVPSGEKQSQWERLRLNFVSGKSLSFEDLRLFGYWQKVENEDIERLKQKLGTDALHITEAEFASKIKNKRVPIKQVLLDQSIISGVGNIYANDALFLARINPQIKARELSSEQISGLIKAIKEVLTVSIKAQGATLGDEMYKTLYNTEGGYKQFAKVYAREGKVCLNNCGATVKKMQLSGRGTYFCPNCQAL